MMHGLLCVCVCVCVCSGGSSDISSYQDIEPFMKATGLSDV